MWYAAHVIMSDSEDEAWAQAERLGREDETDGTDGFRWNGRPASWKFAGVRKLIECRSDTPDDRPAHGAEVSYSQMSVPDKESLAKLVQGKAVEVRYEE